MAVLNGCCCCFSLRTGVIIIAVLTLVFSLIEVGTSGNSLHKHDYVDDDVQNFQNAVDTLDKVFSADFKNQLKDTADNIDTSFNIRGSDSVRATVDRVLKPNKKVTKTQLITVLVFSVIQALCSLMLLFGAIKEKAGLLLPWVIVETLIIIGTTVSTIFIIVMLFQAKETVVTGYVLIGVLALYLLFTIYFLLVVYSLYQSLRENPRRYV